MTIYFVHHLGDGSSSTTDPGTGGDWSGAYPSMHAAQAGLVASGDTVKVSSQHNQATATGDWLGAKGTATSPVHYVCVDHNDTSIRTTGAIETVGGLSSYQQLTGNYRIKGVHLKSGTFGFCKSTTSRCVLEDCIIESTNTNPTQIRLTETSHSRLLLKNCTFRFGNTGSEIVSYGTGTVIRMIGGVIADTGSVPNNTSGFIKPSYVGNGHLMHFSEVDFSNIVAGKLVQDPSWGQAVYVRLDGCKISGSVTDFSLTTIGTSYMNSIERHDADGYFKVTNTDKKLERDLTVVKNGGLGWSSKLEPRYNWLDERILDPALDLSAAKTLTFEIAQYNAGGAPAALTADECKLIVEYPDGTTGQTVETTTIETSTQRWDDDLGAEITTNITKQKLTVVVPNTLGAVGVCTASLLVTKASAVINIDHSPNIV